MNIKVYYIQLAKNEAFINGSSLENNHIGKKVNGLQRIQLNSYGIKRKN